MLELALGLGMSSPWDASSFPSFVIAKNSTNPSKQVNGEDTIGVVYISQIKGKKDQLNTRWNK
jgi:hypothetical protein